MPRTAATAALRLRPAPADGGRGGAATGRFAAAWRAGFGKSSLAAFIARSLGYRYYDRDHQSSSAQDLLWSMTWYAASPTPRDRGAQGDKAPLSDYDYIEPGVLWWVFDRESAALRCCSRQHLPSTGVGRGRPNAGLNAAVPSIARGGVDRRA